MTRDVLYGIAPGLTYFAAVGAAVACGGGPWWGVVGVYVIAVVWAAGVAVALADVGRAGAGR